MRELARKWMLTAALSACSMVGSPEEMPAGDNGQLIYATASTVGADGWVTQTLSVTATSDLDITLGWTSSANLNLFLYDPSGLLVASANSTTARPEVVTFDGAEAGDWVIGIKNKSTTATTYTLSTNVVPLGDESTTGSPAVADPRIPIVSDLNAGGTNKLGEQSGMVRSDQHPNFIWVHRDGHTTEPRIELFAMKAVNRALVSFNGSSGTSPTRRFGFADNLSIDNNNWEDITLGTDVRDGAGHSLYIGDIGNNNGGRNSYQVYQVAEPDPDGASATIGALEATWKFQYPTSAKIGTEFPNCETMFLLDRYIYIVTKESQPRIYRFPNNYFTSPQTTHTLVPVVNGTTTRVVGATSNPSYGQFNRARTRFALGNHGTFKVWVLGTSGLVGDELVRRMLLTPSSPPSYAKAIGTDTTASMNAEGATFDAGTDDVLIGTESKRLYHWPAANYEK